MKAARQTGKGLRLIAAALFLLGGSVLSAHSVVDTVRISVNLQDDGSAIIAEDWQIDVSDDISEWYLVVDNLGKMRITGLGVTDETGRLYETESGEWDIHRNRARKAGRCGLVTKDDGYEVCWGVGSSGPHRYHVVYRLSGLVKAYADMDGFNYMFVSRGQDSPPGYIEVRIFKDGTDLDPDNAKAWGFGYRGDIEFEDGEIVARTSEPFSSRSGLIALCGFEKGIFTPAMEGKGTFDNLRAKAMKGSEYRDESKDVRRLFTLFFSIMAVIFGLTTFAGIRSVVKKRRRRKELLGGVKIKDVAWFRDVPVNGDLRAAAGIIEVLEPAPNNAENLIAAYITRLFYKGAFRVEPDAKGKQVIRIKEVELPGEGEDVQVEKKLYSFFKEAAGEDGLLQNRELKRWIRSHAQQLHTWQLECRTNDNLWSIEPKDVQEVFGLRKFLKDFTLIEDRGVVEVGLWNNYLIFASLFGIADKLKKDFKQVCPEYFELSPAAAQLSDSAGSVLIWDMINTTSHNMHVTANNYATRTSHTGTSWSGGGGHASWGGGGGFSGGGFGGGGR